METYFARSQRSGFPHDSENPLHPFGFGLPC